MKKFLSKYWKRILIIIAIIFIGINIVSKCMAPHALVEEYGKYGPDVEYNNILSGDTSASQIVQDVKESSGLPDDIFSLVMILGIGLIAALIISELANKKSSGGKKK